MTVTLYNTLTRKKERFKPLKDKTVRIYSCGPTVYNYAHIGNLRAYVFADILKRVLQHADLRVKHIINITDVGHLTSNADAGEDKIILASQRERKTVWQIAQFYIDAFKQNIADLNILPPSVWCKATDHIYQQIKLIQKLEKKGYTYCVGGNVYFDTSKFSNYGKLAGYQKTAPAVARVEEDVNKKSVQDFVLWFTKSKFQKQDMKWESPWGVGYPGWHIECSAMSTYYLGQPFDIHTGGIDHIAVHHANEIAQSEAAAGKPLAKFWLHNEFLIIDSKRMGKSEGNFITLQTLIDKGYDPAAYRFFLLQTHYRQQLNFTWQSMDAAQNGYRALRENTHEFIRLQKDATKRKTTIGPLIAKAIKRIDAALCDDLGTPKALAEFFALMSEIHRRGKKLGAGDYKLLCSYIALIDDVFGLALMSNDSVVPGAILELAEQRENARKEKNWIEADRLRMQIEKAGYRIDDMPKGPQVIKT